MTSFFAKLTRGVASAALALGVLGLGTFTPAVANTGLILPDHVRLVENAGDQTWERTPGSLTTGPIQVLVHINLSPMAMVGRYWDLQQRQAYMAQIRAAQDAVIPQVEALGGQVIGRFAQLSTGLAVTIDASRLDDLRTIGTVIGVRGVANYQLDLTDTVPWIGGAALQATGITGAGVDVAVIDSGVDYTHRKLGGPGTPDAYALAYCGSATLPPDPTNPACAAHAAADTSGSFPNAKVVGGYDWVGEKWPTLSTTIAPDPNPLDFQGHGTHVADIIAGLESAPGAGDQGVAPGARLWSFKACSAISTSCNGLAILLALDDAMDLDDSDYGGCTTDCKAYDPADVINLSLGAAYGQPEDDLTLFANIASYYGSLVVVSAGNSGDRPYIVGSPSTAEAALSVAQSTVPSDKMYLVTAESVTAKGVLQPWSPAITGVISGTLQYGDGAGGNPLGCAAFAPGSLAGKVLLVDRGTCAVSLKGANGSAAGAALVLVANNAFSNTPPSFSFGGGTVTAPVLTLTQNEGNALKTVLGSTASTSEADTIALQDDVVATSSRGPRIADGDIKPDITAPGASVSAQVGTGSGKRAFGGTSGAAPMISGAAALVIENLEQAGVLDSDPGLDGPISQAPLVKALLMNNANPITRIGGSFLAPITLQGAGRVDALAAANAETIAWDVTDFENWLVRQQDSPCSVLPVVDVILYAYRGLPPDCANDYPFGNDFFNAWNSQTGSLSFGYDGVSGSNTLTRKIAIYNLSASERTYQLTSSFRYDNDRQSGVYLKASPSEITIGPGSLQVVDVTLKVNAKDLRGWMLNAGVYGDAGTNIFCEGSESETICHTLTEQEYDGFLMVDGGANNTVRLPWQVLPKKAARTLLARHNASSVKLKNPARFAYGHVAVFALMDVSPNNCEIVIGGGSCLEYNYVPGILPGINATPIDLHEIGVRTYQIPGLNAALGLPQMPEGVLNDMVVDFGVTVYDAPYRASHNYPVEFDIYVDADANGQNDYVVFNADSALGTDGRNAVFVADINPADGTRPTQPYFYSDTDFNSQNWILPVPAAAIDVRSDRAFKFYLLAFDAYFTGDLWDCSPMCSNPQMYHTFHPGLPRYGFTTTELHVPPKGSYTLAYTTPDGGAAASPSQDGLLFLYRDAHVGAESETLLLP